MNVINRREDAEYCVRVYLFFSDKSREKIVLQYNVGDDMNTLALVMDVEIRRAIRRKEKSVYLMYADYSATALRGAGYWVDRWMDETTGIVRFDSVLQNLIKRQQDGRRNYGCIKKQHIF